MTEQEWAGCDDPEAMLGLVGEGGNERKLRLFACACCRRAWDERVEARIRAAVEAAERFADGGISLPALDAARRAAEQAEGEIGEEAVNELRRLSAELYPEMDQSDPDLAYGDADCSTEARSAATAASYACRADLSWLGFYPVREAAWAARFYRKHCFFPYIGERRGGWVSERELYRAEGRAQADILRDLFGNPFRPPPAVDPSVLAWHDGTVRRLAHAAYDERHLPAGTLHPGRLGVLADALLDAGCADGELIAHLREPGPHVRGCFAVDVLLGKS
jgi:hypothetical protein